MSEPTLEQVQVAQQDMRDGEAMRNLCHALNEGYPSATVGVTMHKVYWCSAAADWDGPTVYADGATIAEACDRVRDKLSYARLGVKL